MAAVWRTWMASTPALACLEPGLVPQTLVLVVSSLVPQTLVLLVCVVLVSSLDSTSKTVETLAPESLAMWSDHQCRHTSVSSSDAAKASLPSPHRLTAMMTTDSTSSIILGRCCWKKVTKARINQGIQSEAFSKHYSEFGTSENIAAKSPSASPLLE